MTMTSTGDLTGDFMSEMDAYFLISLGLMTWRDAVNYWWWAMACDHHARDHYAQLSESSTGD